MNEFTQKLLLSAFDKLIIGLLIVIAGYWLNRLLEKYKLQQNKVLERFKVEQNKVLEELRGEQALLKEYEVLRDQTSLKHLQRQIEELYSPLVGLIQFGDMVNRVEKQKIRDRAGSIEAGEVRRYLVEKYYLPLNAQISDFIRTKIYLLDSDALPESFQQFLAHAAQFEILHSLWKDMGIRSDDIRGVKYPRAFKQDVKVSLDRLRNNYNENIRRMKTAT